MTSGVTREICASWFGGGEDYGHKPLFDVDNYKKLRTSTSESALRHMASLYAYDHSEEDHRNHAAQQGTDTSQQSLRAELNGEALSKRAW